MAQFAYIEGDDTFECCGQGCDAPYFEMMHHDNKLARAEISRAIKEAEDRIARIIKYYPYPKYLEQEVTLDDNPKDAISKFESICGRYYGHDLPPVQTKWNYLVAVGTLTHELLEANLSVGRGSIYVPANLEEQFVSGVFSVPDNTVPQDIVAFFTAGDRFGEPKEQWQIRPINVVIDSSGGDGNWTATINGPAFCIVRPELYLSYEAIPLTADDNSVYVTEIEVYLKTIDATQQGELIYPNCCAESRQPVCYTIWDRDHGLLVPNPARLDTTVTPNELICNQSLTNCTCGQYRKKPIKADIHYVAGYPLQENGQIDSLLAIAIAKLATHLLQCEFCGCGCLDQVDNTGRRRNKLQRWRTIPGFDHPTTFVAMRKKQMEECPFGETEGALDAWNIIKNYKKRRGIAV
jgi:hypothetical protein